MDINQKLMRGEHRSDGSTVCPHCKTVVEQNGADDVGFGGPFCTCPNCGKDYFDSEKEEISIGIYNAQRSKTIKEALASMLLYIFLIAAVTALTYYMIEMSAFAFFLILFLFILDPVSVWLKKKDQKRRVDYLEGRAEERTLEVIESMNRLSSKGYLEALKANGVKVPNFFYRRLKGTESNTMNSNYEDYSRREPGPSQAGMNNPFESKEKTGTGGKMLRIVGVIVVIAAAAVVVLHLGEYSLSIRDLLPNISESSNTQEQAEKAEKNSEAEEVAADESMKGYIEGNTWYNEFLGIQLTLDEGWEFRQTSNEEWVYASRKTENGNSFIMVTSEYLGQDRDSYTPEEFEKMRMTAHGIVLKSGYDLNGRIYGEAPFLGKDFAQIKLHGMRDVSDSSYSNRYARFIPIVQKGFVVTILLADSTDDRRNAAGGIADMLYDTEDGFDMFHLFGDGFASTGTMEGEWNLPDMTYPETICLKSTSSRANNEKPLSEPFLKFSTSEMMLLRYFFNAIGKKDVLQAEEPAGTLIAAPPTSQCCNEIDTDPQCLI